MGNNLVKIRYFNPRPPRGGRLPFVDGYSLKPGISIHAPREGGDFGFYYSDSRFPDDFNPRPPRGGRLNKAGYKILDKIISIHAPREGGDRGTDSCFRWI